MSKHFIVDGSNVCYWRGRVSIAPLIRLLIELIKSDCTFFCVFDARTPYEFKNAKATNDFATYEQLVKQYPNYFAEATGGIQADNFILALADKQEIPVISNDRYRKFQDQYAWVVSETSRLIKGQVMAEDLVVPNLNILVTVGNNLADALKELKSLLPSQAQIDPKVFEGCQVITNWHSGKALDLSEYSDVNGVKVHQWDSHGQDNQQWEFQRVPDEKTVLIVSKVNGKCLDVANQSLEEGGVVHSWNHVDGDNQKWYLDQQEDGSYRIRAKHSGMCLDVADWSEDNWAFVQQYPWHGGGNQKWWIEPA